MVSRIKVLKQKLFTTGSGYWILKKTAAVIIVAAVHFGLCSLVNSAALSGTAASVLETGLPFSTSALLWLSRVLYFPILSLHLVSRNWFPGDLILIVMAANSLFWGIAVVLGTSAVRKLTRKRGGTTRSA
jgi:hypothetical protein